jgi:hypothetical protein
VATIHAVFVVTRGEERRAIGSFVVAAPFDPAPTVRESIERARRAAWMAAEAHLAALHARGEV